MRYYLDPKYKDQEKVRHVAVVTTAKPSVVEEAKKVLGEEKVEQLKREIIKRERPKIEKKFLLSMRMK